MMKRWPRVGTFVAEEEGNITVFSVFMLVLIIATTGASVDIMRFEAVRAKMQSTMDRAVLAAADLEQEQDPVAVVNDYMTKAGLGNALNTVSVDEGLNYRTVSADGSVELSTIFLHMSGFDTLTTPARSTAEEKISNVEVSLVLDVSGSMGGSRIENMRNAAREFVETVIQPEGSPGLTSVSLVPYSAVVNVGETLAPYFNFDEAHDYSHCAAFKASDFQSAAFDGSATLERIGHFDPWSSDQSSTQIASPWCPTGDTSAIMVHSADLGDLTARIDSLTAGGNTAIDLGMKWGVSMLDPSFGPIVGQMASDGLVSGQVATRPAQHNDPEAIKFVVVMTDGENTSQFDLKPGVKDGMSDLWVDDRGNGNPNDDRFSLRVRDLSGTANDVYFWKRYETSSYSSRYRNTPDGGSNARRMTYAEVYARWGTAAFAQSFYVRPYYDNFVSYNQYYDVYYAYEQTVSGSQGDQRLSDICEAARNQGIVIFAIAFEAPAGGQQALQDCASSPSHYFDVEGVEITETFHAIARQINSLRLVQ